jgi:hypothetical protein
MNYHVEFGTYEDNEAIRPTDNTYYTRQEAVDVAAQLAEVYPFVNVWMKIPRVSGYDYSECVLSYEDGLLTEVVDDVEYIYEWDCEKMAYVEIFKQPLQPQKV